jgi:hypothetical protein
MTAAGSEKRPGYQRPFKTPPPPCPGGSQFFPSERKWTQSQLEKIVSTGYLICGSIHMMSRWADRQPTPDDYTVAASSWGQVAVTSLKGTRIPIDHLWHVWDRVEPVLAPGRPPATTVTPKVRRGTPALACYCARRGRAILCRRHSQMNLQIVRGHRKLQSWGGNLPVVRILGRRNLSMQ